MSPVRIAILASGHGSNALALLRTAQELGAAVQVPLLVCDRPQAPVLDKLTGFATLPLLVERTGSRAQHEQAILRALDAARVDWILLAGYMRLLSPEFIAAWRQRHGGAQQIVNIHPSRLPDYPGLDAVQRAVAAGEPEIGVTLHHVDEGMDTGQVIAQETLAPTEGESMPALMARVHALEHGLYADFLRGLALGRPATIRHNLSEES